VICSDGMQKRPALTPSQDLESKILESIRQADNAQHDSPAAVPVRPLYRHAFRYAAAAVVFIGLGMLLVPHGTRLPVCSNGTSHCCTGRLSGWGRAASPAR